MKGRDWVMGNGKIVKDSAIKLFRFNAGAALDLVQPHLSKIQFGPSPFESDWDMLVVLDTCRVDAMREVAPDYDFIESVDIRRSPASWSRDWLAKSFPRERWAHEMSRTAFIAWNPFTEYELEADDWLLLDEVHQEVWDEDLSCIPPEHITDRSIQAARELDPDRIIVWYQQPHKPYRSIETEPLPWEELGRTDTERRGVWDRVQDPDDPLTPREVYEGHVDNLRWALDDVADLLENVDAPKTVITADHGESIGEFMHFGHGAGLPFPQLIRVPWVETTAVDRGTREPKIVRFRDRRPNHPEKRDQLEALGYA